MPAYQLSLEAELDLEGIAEYTIKKHGEDQMIKYVTKLEVDAENLAIGVGYFKVISEINSKLRMVKSGKHYIFGLMRDNSPMIVIAILHERMHLIKRLKNRLS